MTVIERGEPARRTQPGRRAAGPETVAASDTSDETPVTYTLCYEDDHRGLEKRVRFEARSPAIALDIARGEAEGRWALLMRGGEILCRLEREDIGPGSLWVIDGPGSQHIGASPWTQ